MVDLGDVKNALKKKIHLCALYLFFNMEFKEEEEETDQERRRRRRMENDIAVLNALEPPLHLEQLFIGCVHKCTTLYPNWMMSKLTYLKRLTLGRCPNLVHLPPLGKLPLLQVLNIGDAPNVGKVGEEFWGIDIEEELLESS